MNSSRKGLRQRFTALLLAFCCFALLCAPASAGDAARGDTAKEAFTARAAAGASAAAAKDSSGETVAADFFDGILSYLAAADKRSSADPQVILDEGCDPYEPVCRLHQPARRYPA